MIIFDTETTFTFHIVNIKAEDGSVVIADDFSFTFHIVNIKGKPSPLLFFLFLSIYIPYS